MNEIGWAIKQMRLGYRATRAGWNGKGMWLAIQNPDTQSKMGLPYVYMKTARGPLVPWLCSQTDLLATDWEIVGEPDVAHATGVQAVADAIAGQGVLTSIDLTSLL